jgi:hypothetical protein
MAFLRSRIEHVIYIVKENKTYDQVLGDLPRGNGDPTLTQYPQPVSPNHHSLAMTFGLLDNFYDTGQVSGDGWGWSTYAETTDYNEKTIAVNYGNGGNGVTYDAEGTNRLIGVGLPDSDDAPSQFTVRLTSVLDPTGSSAILPGTKDVNAPFGSSNLSADTVGGHCGIRLCEPTRPCAITASSSMERITLLPRAIPRSRILFSKPIFQSLPHRLRRI